MPATAATAATFDETIAATDRAVLVDFWAEWCGPCRALAPVLDDLADSHADVLRVVKVDVDENPGVARRFDIMSIPTMVVFRDGEPVRRIVGARGKDQLLAELADLL